MDKQPASLLDGISSLFGMPQDDINPTLSQYVLRSGIPYLSPAHIMTSVNGPWGVPYWMQGIPVQTCDNSFYTAPLPYEASKITHAVGTATIAPRIGTGSAPTGGIFTGVEDHCT